MLLGKLKLAIKSCNAETVRTLLDEVKVEDKTFDINAPFSSPLMGVYGDTLLGEAASEGRIEIIRMLVKNYNANVNVRALWGTPIEQAVGHGHAETVRMLVKECHADFSTANILGQTPVWIAASLGRTATVRVLVQECGADINVSDHDDRSTLGIAVIWGHTDTVELLLNECYANVADVNKPDRNGYTPIWWAAAGFAGGNCQSMVRMLRKMLASRNFKGNRHLKKTVSNCPICLQDIAPDNSMVLRPCGHQVCKSCNIQLGVNYLPSVARLCPICRTLVEERTPLRQTPDYVRIRSRFCVQVP